MNVKDLNLKIEKVPLAIIAPYEGNAKQHTNEQIRAVENSIKEFGFANPVILWHNDDGFPEIVAGHARCKAAENLGMSEVPAVFVDALTDAQRRALTLADNQTTMMTGWDIDQLNYELENLSGMFDMGDFGFPEDSSLSGDDIDKLFSDYDHTNAEQKPKTIVCPECGHVFEA